MKALNKNILVKMVEEVKEESAFVIRTSDEETLCRAEVVSVGSKVEDDSIVVGGKCLVFKNHLVKVNKEFSLTVDEKLLVMV